MSFRFFQFNIAHKSDIICSTVLPYIVMIGKLYAMLDAICVFYVNSLTTL